MKKLIWAVIVAFGLASLPFGENAFAGQGHVRQAHKTAAKAGKAGKMGKAGKHHGKKHRNQPAGKKHKHK
jgi:hypothetical protein